MAEFANHIIEQLELGIKPWGQAGNPDLCAGSRAPFKAATGHRYSGVNVLMLAIDRFQSRGSRYPV